MAAKNGRYDKVGGEASGTAGATAKLEFSGGDAAFAREGGFLITSCGAADLYLKLVARGAAAPTLTALNYLIRIPSGETVHVNAGRALDAYIFGTTEYFAQELG
jgi:hypothetical protein